MPAAARRDQLLDAALQIIARDGYAAVSIESIAREADVTRPVVYNVFTGLDDLLTALLDRQERRALDQLLATITAPPDLADISGWLRGVVEDLVAMVAGDPLTWRPIFLTFAATPGVVRERIATARETVREQIERLVTIAMTLRPAPSGVDALVVSHLLVAVGEYYGRTILENPDSVDAERLAATIAALLPL
jgi:AcrR family transcriptional regulator